MTNRASDEKSVFLGALARAPGDERDAYLREACCGEPSLFDRMQKLMSAYEQPSGPLDLPPPGLNSPPGYDSSSLEGPGTQIGHYKLLEQIGEGGFGIVFMAEQTEPLRRKVALKVLKAGMDTRQVIARFEAERQALALMDHPNIAKVLDAGTTPSNRPYFAMELVRGIPITDFCNQADVTPLERLRLFLSVCRAVQHAHQKGIIHRDLKPTNVLVTLHDGTPTVKVIDFGIAKAVGQQLTEKTLFTSFAQMLGTPVYMSPEQAALSGWDVDTRSDIYSLGVLLYELLTGVTPFEKERLAKADFDEMRRIIREEDPARPSTRVSTLARGDTAAVKRQTTPRLLSRLIRGELDCVVMKCLSKDRTQRYDSVSGLAADLERYLAGQPIEARPPSAAYRLRKFVSRNRVAITTIALVAAALLAGISASTWQALRATNAERITRRALAAEKQAGQEAIAARQRAEANFQKARQAVERYFTLVSQSDLLDQPGLQPLRKDLLEAALGYYQDFLRERVSDNELKVELAAAFFRAGQVCHLIDRNDEAIEYLKHSVSLVEELLSDPLNSEALKLHMAGLHQAGRTLHGGTRLPSDPQAALAALKRAIELWERLVREHPQTAGFRSDLAGFYSLTGDLFRSLAQRAEAIQAYERARRLLDELLRNDPHNANYRVDLASCHEVLGLLARQKGQVSESDEAFKKALALREELVAEQPERPGLRMELAGAYRQLATQLYVDQPQRALDSLQRADAILRRLTADYPGIPAYEELLARVQAALAEQCWQKGDRQRAEDASREALAIFERLAKRFPSSPLYRERLLEYYRDLYPRLIAIERADDAKQALGQILLLEKSLAAEFPDMAHYHEQLARTLVMCPYEELRDEPLAVRAAQRAVELSPKSGNCWKTLGAAYYRAAAAGSSPRDWQAAIDALEKSLTLPPGPKGTNRLFLAMSYWQMTIDGNARPALTAEERNRYRDQARQLFEQAQEWIEQNRADTEGMQRLQAEARGLLEIDNR